MSDAKPLKSQFELTMERFEKSDAEEGVKRKPMTDAQKAAIAEIRNFYDAKLAEIETLHQGHRMTSDLAEQAALEETYHRDRARLASERDAKIEKVHRGEATE